MSDVREIPPAAPQKDGVPLVTGVIRAADQNAEIGGGRQTLNTRRLSPSEARKVAADEWLPDAPTGADALYTTVRPQVKDDRELAAERRRDMDADLSENAERRKAEADASVSAKLAADFHAHAAKIQAMAAEAKGDPLREAQVSAQISQSAALGDELKRRGIL